MAKVWATFGPSQSSNTNWGKSGLGSSWGNPNSSSNANSAGGFRETWVGSGNSKTKDEPSIAKNFKYNKELKELISTGKIKLSEFSTVNNDNFSKIALPLHKWMQNIPDLSNCPATFLIYLEEKLEKSYIEVDVPGYQLGISAHSGAPEYILDIPPYIRNLELSLSISNSPIGIATQSSDNFNWHNNNIQNYMVLLTMLENKKLLASPEVALHLIKMGIKNIMKWRSSHNGYDYMAEDIDDINGSLRIMTLTSLVSEMLQKKLGKAMPVVEMKSIGTLCLAASLIEDGQVEGDMYDYMKDFNKTFNDTIELLRKYGEQLGLGTAPKPRKKKTQ